LERLNERCNEYGLKINFKKTNGSYKVHAESEPCEPDGGKHHGTCLEQTGDQTRKIRTKVEIARTTFIKMKN